jgi:FG-GAP repeat/IPT/TIG domain
VRSLLSRIAAGLSVAGLLLPLGVASAVGTSTQFTDPAPEAGDGFGYALSISQKGDIAVVGAPDATVSGNSLEGTAYVFANSGGSWSKVAQLNPTDGTQYDRFGGAVSITPDGSKIIVGAYYTPTANVTTTESGKAYIFNVPAGGWANSVDQSAELTPSDATSGNNDNFGSAVAFSADGSTAIVGAKYHGGSTNMDQGEAYVYSQPGGGWTGNLNENAKLAASDGTAFIYFGWSVAASADGSSVLVGAPGGGSGNTASGSAYVYTKPADGWNNTSITNESSKLTSNDGNSGDLFGLSVGLTSEGQTAVIGSPNHTFGSITKGSAYVFGNNAGTWSQTTELNAADGQAGDNAGFSVAVAGDGSSLLVGAPGAVAKQGVAYQYNPDNNGVWTLNSELTPSTSGPDQDFGWASFVVDDASQGNAFIGAPNLTAPSSQAPSSFSLQGLNNLNKAGKGGGTVSGGRAYLFNVTPVVTRISATSGQTSDKVTIKGTGLSFARSVKFNGVSAAITSNSATLIKVTVPAAATSGPVTVTTPNGTVTATSQFTVAAPSIKSIPKSASRGSTITIKGSGLAGVTQVQFNGANAVPSSTSDKQVTVVVPAGANSGPITVIAPSGQGTSASSLSVL